MNLVLKSNIVTALTVLAIVALVYAFMQSNIALAAASAASGVFLAERLDKAIRKAIKAVPVSTDNKAS